MTLTFEFIILTVGLVLVPPVIYFGAPLGGSRGSVTAQEAVAIAFAGIITVEFAEFLFGGVPALEWALAPFTWIVVVKHLCPVTWSTAAVIGILSWGLSATVTSILLLI